MTTASIAAKLRQILSAPEDLERGIITGRESRNVVIVRTSNGVVQATNMVVASRVGLPVIIARFDNEWIVTGLDYFSFLSPPQYHAVPYHAEAHVMGHQDGGDDLVFLPKLQYLPLEVVPTLPPSKLVRVCRGTLINAEGRVSEFSEALYDFSPIIDNLTLPKAVLLVINREMLLLEIIEPADAAIPSNVIPLAVIRLRPSQTQIRWEDIVDIRELPASRIGATSLELLNDVCVANPADREVLLWDATNSCWKNLPIPSGSGVPTTPFIIRPTGVVTYDTIQSAINDSQPGEVVFIPPKTYTESLVIPSDKFVHLFGWGCLGSVIIEGSGTLVEINGPARFHNIYFHWLPTSSTTVPMIKTGDAITPSLTECEFSIYSNDNPEVVLFETNYGLYLELCHLIATGVQGGTIFHCGTNMRSISISKTSFSLDGSWILRDKTDVATSFFHSYIYAGTINYNESDTLFFSGTVAHPLANLDAEWAIMPVKGASPNDVIVWDGAKWAIGSQPAGFPLKPFIIRNGVIIQFPDFASAAADAQDGETIYIPPGIHTVSTNVVISVTLTIRGMGGTLHFTGPPAGLSANGQGLTIADLIIQYDYPILGLNVLIGCGTNLTQLRMQNVILMLNSQYNFTPIPIYFYMGSDAVAELTNLNIVEMAGSTNLVIGTERTIMVQARNCHLGKSQRIVGGLPTVSVDTDMYGCTADTLYGSVDSDIARYLRFTNCDFRTTGVTTADWTIPVPVTPATGDALNYQDRWRLLPDYRQFVFCFPGNVAPGFAPLLMNEIRSLTMIKVTARIRVASSSAIDITVDAPNGGVNLTLPAGSIYAETSANIAVAVGHTISCQVTSGSGGSDLTVTAITK